MATQPKPESERAKAIAAAVGLAGVLLITAASFGGMIVDACALPERPTLGAAADQ